MEVFKISPKFQIDLPHNVRGKPGFCVGDALQVIAFRKSIQLIPVQSVQTLRGYLKGIDTSFTCEGDRV